MKKRILIVSFKVGMGHVKAAAAIAEQFSEKNIEVKTIDLSDYSSLVSKGIYQKGYLRMVNNVPALYSFFYKHTLHSGIKLRVFFDSVNATRFKQLVADFQPDVIVSTHFIVSSLVSHWRDDFDKDIKLLFSMTDYDGHPLMIDKNIDVYTVPSPEVSSQIKSLGASNKVCVTGIPVSKKFNKKYFKPKLRSQFGLDDRFTVLVMNGGFGVGKARDILETLCEAKEDFQIIITAGHNNRLKRSLENVAAKSNKKIKVFGFTDQIAELMAVSDIIISKAGGLTVSESLAIGTPLIVFEPTPGQEEANSHFLTENNAAIMARSLLEAQTFVSLAANKIVDLNIIRRNIKKIARPFAAAFIKKEIINLLK